MPAPRGKVPAYCLHKASGRAVVRLNGRDHYLGPYGSPDSHALYAKLIANWRSNQPSAPCPPRVAPDWPLSINEMLVAYLEFAQTYYTKDGRPNKEYDLLCYAVRPLKQLFGYSQAVSFGPRDLKTIQQQLIEKGLSRSYINGQVNRIKRVFKWAVGEELISPTVWHGIQSVTGLRRGRSAAREKRPVRPVSDRDVEAVLPFVAPPVASMIRLQRLTGMRSGELVIMRGCDLDRSSDVWLYTPSSHKNQWREQAKSIPLGPRAQKILSPYLARPEQDYIFSPKEAAEWHRDRRCSNTLKLRKTKVFPSEVRRLALEKQARLLRTKLRSASTCYNTGSYRQAVQYGIEQARKAGVDVQSWHPHQLRHTKATEIRHDFGLEAAQVALGHSRADVTQIYAERNHRQAIELARSTG